VTSLASEAFAVRVLDAMHTNGGAMIRHHDGIHLIDPTAT
jgi:hypothetical protein